MVLVGTWNSQETDSKRGIEKYNSFVMLFLKPNLMEWHKSDLMECHQSDALNWRH